MSVVLITGGGSGIGRAIGEAMGREGHLVVLADRAEQRAREVAEGIEAQGGRAIGRALDVRDREAFVALAKELRDSEGSVDYLFNNAGIAIGGRVSDYQPGDWDEVLDVNLRGVVHGIDAVYPIMRAQGSGHIVNTASMAGFLPLPGGASYAASKHAVVGLSKALRIEAAQHRVRVSVVCPGAIQTPILVGGEFGAHRGLQLSEEQMRALWALVRPMNVDDFARRVLDEVARNEPFIVVPRWWKAVWLLERLAPRLSLELFGRVYRRQLERLGASDESREAPLDEHASAH